MRLGGADRPAAARRDSGWKCRSGHGLAELHQDRHSMLGLFGDHREEPDSLQPALHPSGRHTVRLAAGCYWVTGPAGPPIRAVLDRPFQRPPI